jgi:hypothetical protein
MQKTVLLVLTVLDNNALPLEFAVKLDVANYHNQLTLKRNLATTGTVTRWPCV